MSIEAKRYHLIERVMQFNEREIDKIETFLEEESELSASLDKALEQVDEGKVTPHSEVRKKYEKWLLR
ncbi:MAG: hypothetical protein RLN88_11630 [Ekhidna sp.]|uniref:hypothetical protein n=1 Tax=Ekhidna sp. TaxID=2608089 RepID=UPI0032EEFAA6